MAWISVHEQVLGFKLRKLSKSIGCSQNEALGLLIRLWLWCINNADSTGKIVGANKEDIAEILAIGIDNQYLPESVIDSMLKTNWLDEENGSLYVHDWEQWQKQWYKALEVREKDAERKRRKAKQEREKEARAGGESVSLSLQPTKDKTQPRNEYGKDFEKFWEIYPRKDGKGEAYKKYVARKKDGFSAEELLLAANNYRNECESRRTEKIYIKHAKTFLSENTPFMDYLPKRNLSEAIEPKENPFSEWEK